MSFLFDQYNNPKNIEAHQLTTGPEIWNETHGKIDYLIACGSSGGTIRGIARFLKSKNSKIKVILADPYGSAYYDYFKSGQIIKNKLHTSKIEGAGKDHICACMDFSVIDDVVQFTDEKAIETTKSPGKGSRNIGWNKLWRSIACGHGYRPTGSRW